MCICVFFKLVYDSFFVEMWRVVKFDNNMIILYFVLLLFLIMWLWFWNVFFNRKCLDCIMVIRCMFLSLGRYLLYVICSFFVKWVKFGLEWCEKIIYINVLDFFRGFKLNFLKVVDFKLMWKCSLCFYIFWYFMEKEWKWVFKMGLIILWLNCMLISW